MGSLPGIILLFFSAFIWLLNIVFIQNILTAGGIPPITRLLACTTDRIMINALVTIHSLLLCFDQVGNLIFVLKEKA